MPQEILDDEFTNELSRACEIENFPPDTKLQYIRDMFTEMDYQAEMEAKYQKGFAAGEADGEARGRMAGVAEGKRDIATAMLRKGLDADLIASCTGLSIEDVKGLQRLG